MCNKYAYTSPPRIFNKGLVDNSKQHVCVFKLSKLNLQINFKLSTCVSGVGRQRNSSSLSVSPNCTVEDTQNGLSSSSGWSVLLTMTMHCLCLPTLGCRCVLVSAHMLGITRLLGYITYFNK